MNKQRIAASLLAISVGGVGAWKAQEGFTYDAIIPTKNDRPTLGYGATFWEDGSPVKMGESITRERAEALAEKHLNDCGGYIRRNLGDIPMSQSEFDSYSNFICQFGWHNFKNSSMRRYLMQGNYEQACISMLKYKYSGGFDCSIPGNKVCWGVWDRQKKRVDTCLNGD